MFDVTVLGPRGAQEVECRSRPQRGEKRLGGPWAAP